ncbi:MAG TPA: hypothetical protein VGN20_00630 [Mucilaginibacter sp.]|jgi:hypothetical protein
MEEITPDNGQHPGPNKKKHIPEVYILRDWKEYVGESFLIIFSVILALIVTEFFSNLHEKRETQDLINNIRTELETNKKFETEQYAYQLKVLRSIDSALANPEIQKTIVSNDEFHLKKIAPEGILYRKLNNAAWEIAKSHDILSKIDFKTVQVLTYIYQDQDRIMKVEDEVAKVIFNEDSRKTEDAHLTLMLIRDNYNGWAVDRAPGLLKQYDKAIKLLEEEK